MKQIELRPDLKTAGGEISDILVGGRFAGTMTLVYREGDRLSGSVQLDEDALRAEDMDRVLTYVRAHIQSFIHAVKAATCDVLVTYSPYEQIVTTTEDADDSLLSEDEPYDSIAYEEYELDDDDDISDDSDHDIVDVVDLDDEWVEAAYELVLVGKKRNRLQYHVYDENEFVAEAYMRVEEGEVRGDVSWRVEPDDEEIELVTELIVSDFDEHEIDQFQIDHRYQGTVLETVELTHEELLDTPVEMIGGYGEANFSAMLVRDDGDVLTYEIYSEADGSLPIGSATVDIQHRRLTGFIDFREQRHADDTGAIAAVLMRELDKEKDYDGLNLALMYRNRLIDEFIVENETIH